MLTARRNSAQGLLSTTYILDLEYRVVGDGGEAEEKSLFVKVTLHRTSLLDLDNIVQVPLPDQSGVNVREHAMLGRVLPELQTFIEDHCTGIVYVM